MFRLFKFTSAIALFLVFTPVSLLAKDETIISADDLRKVSKLMSTDKRFSKYHSICVADNFGEAQSYSNKIGLNSAFSSKDCESNLKNCFSKCKDGNGEACFHLARVFQKTEPYYAQQAFAFGCAAGYHAACTNRGAGMRNGDYKDEPVRVWLEKKHNACLFRLFDTACKEDSGWGCVMLGQAYLLGEGVQEDLSKARSIFLKICKKPYEDHPSCEYARAKLKQLNQ